jgi:hypothetical protein
MDAPEPVNSGSGCPALPHHGARDAQREIKRGVRVEDEMDAALAPYVEVQGNAGAVAVDGEHRIQRVTAESCAWDRRGLARRMAGAIVVSSHITYSARWFG